MQDIFLNRNQFEDALIYYNFAQERRECVFVHLPGARPRFFLAHFQRSVLDEPVCSIELALEELRMWYEFFSMLKEAGVF